MTELSRDGAQTVPRSRVVFVDLARACAVLFMVQGHTLHVLLQPGYESDFWFGPWLFLRGLTSCLFLLLSGFAFSVVTDRHWEDFLSLTPRLTRRLTRFLFFLGLGYLLHFPMARFAHLPFATNERWRSFLQVDILQVVAVSLLLLQGLIALLGTRRRYLLGCSLVAAVAVLATPLTWRQTWTDVTPLWFASFMSSETGSLFPFFPWAAFIFIGAALGVIYTHLWSRRPIGEVAAWFWGVGIVVVLVGLLALALPFRPYGEIDVWRTSPSTFLVRLGAVLILLGGFAWVGQRMTRLPAVLQALAEESLTIYVVHVLLLYGSLWNAGLGTVLGPQSLQQTVTWIAVLLTAMSLLAWAWRKTKRIHPWLTNAIRVVIGYFMLRPLL